MKTLFYALTAIGVFACSPDAPVVSDRNNVDWSTYLGDPGRSHYSVLEQITRDNVSLLEEAWSYDSGELRDGGSTMYTSPLVVDGILYGLSPRLVAFALDAATGEELGAMTMAVVAQPSAG